VIPPKEVALMEKTFALACAMDLKSAYNAISVLSINATRGHWTFTTRLGSPTWSPPTV
jgi:hypothetical protein